jgi:hypothetical protein
MARGGATRWRKGQSGNPLGLKRHSALTVSKIRKMIEGAADAIVLRQIELAKKGHPLVARALLAKILPDAKSAPIESPIALTGSLADRAEAILAGLAAGELSQDSAAALMSAVRATQEISDASELRQRLVEIENTLAKLTAGTLTPSPVPKQRSVDGDDAS